MEDKVSDELLAPTVRSSRGASAHQRGSNLTSIEGGVAISLRYLELAIGSRRLIIAEHHLKFTGYAQHRWIESSHTHGRGVVYSFCWGERCCKASPHGASRRPSQTTTSSLDRW
eukprot:scaffold280950_cov30-Tisochrysis_lutea.AAC.6